MNLKDKKILADKMGLSPELHGKDYFVWSATNGNRCYLKDWNPEPDIDIHPDGSARSKGKYLGYSTGE